MVYFIKHVDIPSPRLNALYFALVCIWLAVLVWISLNFDMYHRYVPVGPDIWTRIYVESTEFSITSFQSLKEGFAKMKQEDFCTNPSHDFWWDNEGRWTYENFTCLDLCDRTAAKSGDGCISRHDIVRDVTSSSITFVTEIDKIPYDGSKQTSHFVPWDPDDMTFMFYYGTRTRDLSWFSAYRTEKEIQSHASYSDILTVVLNHKGEEVEVKEPSAAQYWTISKVLSLAAENLKLDDPTPGGAKNYKSDPGQPTVTPRVSGLNIKASLDCYTFPPTHKDWSRKNGPVCYLRFDAVFGPWNGDLTSRGTHDEFYHGLHIFIAKGGIFAYPSFSEAVNCIVDFVVLISLPKLIVFLIATYLLGRTSKIYSQAMTTRFDIFEEAAAAASRLMTYSVDFKRFAGESSCSISKQTVAEQLTSAMSVELQNRDMQSSEMMALVNFCYQAMLKMEKPTVCGDMRTLMSRKGFKYGRHTPMRQWWHAEVLENEVTNNMWHSCCSSNEGVTFQDLAALFEREKDIGEWKIIQLMQKLFTEKSIDAFCEDAVENFDKEPEAIRRLLLRVSQMSRAFIPGTPAYSSRFTAAERERIKDPAANSAPRPVAAPSPVGALRCKSADARVYPSAAPSPPAASIPVSADSSGLLRLPTGASQFTVTTGAPQFTDKTQLPEPAACNHAVSVSLPPGFKVTPEVVNHTAENAEDNLTGPIDGGVSSGRMVEDSTD